MKKKRYTKKGNTIYDSGGLITYTLIKGEIHCASSDPELDLNFHSNPIIGDEAESVWKDLLNRVNNKKHPYYYQPPSDGVYRR